MKRCGVRPSVRPSVCPIRPLQLNRVERVGHTAIEREEKTLSSYRDDIDRTRWLTSQHVERLSTADDFRPPRIVVSIAASRCALSLRLATCGRHTVQWNRDTSNMCGHMWRYMSLCRACTLSDTCRATCLGMCPCLSVHMTRDTCGGI